MIQNLWEAPVRRGQQTFKRRLRLRMFVDAYIVSMGNARRAALLAGCRGKPESLRVSGHRLLRQARAEGLFAKRMAGEDIDADLWASLNGSSKR